MALEDKIDALIKSLDANTAALKEARDTAPNLLDPLVGFRGATLTPLTETAPPAAEAAKPAKRRGRPVGSTKAAASPVAETPDPGQEAEDETPDEFEPEAAGEAEAEALVEEAKPAEPAAVHVTAEMVREVAMEMKEKMGLPCVKAILQKFKADKLAALPPDSFAEFHAAVRTALDEFEAEDI